MSEENVKDIFVLDEGVGGFLVVASLPSKSLLEDSLPKFFEDVSIGKEVIRLLQGYFYNKLGSLSRKFYTQILPKYTIKTPFGYLLPPEFLNDFTREVKELKKEYEKYEKDLNAFINEGRIPSDCKETAEFYPEYINIVKKYLKIDRITVPPIASRVSINILPFVISKRFVEAIAKEEVSKMTQQLIYETKAKIAEAVTKEIEEKFSEIIENLKNYQKAKVSKRALRNMKRDAEKLVSLARQYGVKSSRVLALERLNAELEELEDGKIDINVSNRLEALLREIGGE